MTTPLKLQLSAVTVHASLVKLDAARLALADARTLPEVKKIRDIAEAAKIYAKAAHLGRESQNYAAEIALLASRKAGEILSQLKKTPKQLAAKKSADTSSGDSEYRRTLNETGTPERTAQRWQKLAEIPQPAFENYVSGTREKQQDITAAGLLKVASPKAQSKPQTVPNSPVRILREWLRTECPDLDAIVQSHVKYKTESENFNFEIRDITEEEVKIAARAILARRKKAA